MRRRRLLALLGIGATSGCLRLAGDDERTRRTTTRTTRTTATETSSTTRDAATEKAESTVEQTEEPTTTDAEASTLAEADALELRWEGPEYASGLALHDDVFVETRGLVALDRAQGFESWQPYPDDRVRHFTVEGDDLFVGTGDGEVVAIDLDTRSERWRYAGTGLESAIRSGSSSVVFAEERGDGGAVVCLDAADGMERWRVETANRVSELSPPGSDAVVFGTTGGPDIRCHDLQTGSRRWQSDASHTAMTPLVRNGTAYVPVYRRVLAFDVETGDIAWEYRLSDAADRFEGRSPGHPPVLRDDVLYVPAWEGGVAAVDSRTGESEWFYEVPDSRAGLVTVDDGAVWFGTGNAIHRVDAATGDGETIGRFSVETSELSGFEVDAGTLFVTPSPTAVRAFDVVQ